MRAHWKKKTVVLTLGLTLVVGGGGAAFAYWTAGGSGTGTATTDTTTKDIVVTQTTSVSGLYPGGPAVALAGTLTNPNSGKVQVAQVNATITAVSSSGTTPTCSPSDYQLNGFPVTVNAEVDPAATTAWSGASIQMLDTGNNQDGCKGATVTITYTSN